MIRPAVAIYRTATTGLSIYSSGPGGIDDGGQGDDVTSEATRHRPREYFVLDALLLLALASALVGLARGAWWGARRLFN